MPLRIFNLVVLISLSLNTFTLDLKSEEIIRDDSWEHRYWIERAGRLLSGGVPLPPGRVETLADMTPEQVVDELMLSPLFADMILDFNLYFLGAKPAEIYSIDDNKYRRYSLSAMAWPQAFAAAKAVFEGGSYDSLFSDYPHWFFAPVGSPTPPSSDSVLTDEEIRNLLLEEIRSEFERMTDKFYPSGRDNDPDVARGCLTVFSSYAYFRSRLYRSGIFQQPGNYALQNNFTNQMATDMYSVCRQLSPTIEEFIDLIRYQRAAMGELFERAELYLADSYQVENLLDLRELDDVSNRYLRGSSLSIYGFWEPHRNSSTNFNRNRAAFFLDTFFCDDLTPIGFVPEDVAIHTTGRHASDPGCQSCHYKLDPMAGFFKDRGLLGYDFEGRDTHVFGDNAGFRGEELEAYRNSWPKVGYIRSARNPDNNDYGEGLDDLWMIIAKAPEVKKCLTKRITEYVLGKDQVVDTGWVDYLADRFGEEPSGQALKKTIKDLVLSNTFRKYDSRLDECYDFYPPDSVPELPCQVAHIVKESCAMCHNIPDPRVGGLDMTQWKTNDKSPDGKDVKAFVHLDEEGQQVPPAETFRRIVQRLDSLDARTAMPKNRDMLPTRKVTLREWATDRIESFHSSSRKSQGEILIKERFSSSNASISFHSRP